MATRKAAENTKANAPATPPDADQNQGATNTAPPAPEQNQGGNPPAEPPAPPAKKEPVKALSVASKDNGFRRAGRAWSAAATVVPLSELSDEQVAQLKAELLLTVTEVDLPAE